MEPIKSTTPQVEAHLEPHVDPHEPMPEGEEAPPPGARTMALVRWALIVLMAVGAVAAGVHHFGFLHGGAAVSGQLYHCPMHPTVTSDHPGECPICGMDLVPVAGGEVSEPHAAHQAHEAEPPSAALPPGHEGHRHDPSDPYFCPMHPEETSLDPKARCPLCNMKLSHRDGAPEQGHEGHPQEGHQDHPKAPGAEAVPGLVPIMLSAERVQMVGMKTAKVERRPLSAEIHAVGSIAADEAGLARIQTRFSGWIEELRVAQTGERVEKGQVLATVYSPDLFTAQQEYLSARRWAHGGGASELSGGLQDDACRKLELLGVSAPEIEEIERSGKPIRALKIRSPVRGWVVSKSALQGLYVQPGSELFEVADLARVWLLAEVYENDLRRVKPGQAAKLELAAYPERTFAGKVDFVYPVVDGETRTLRVRMVFKNPDLELKPGMFGDVTLRSEPVEGLVVPREAVVDAGREQYAFVAGAEGRFEPRLLKLGSRDGEWIQVLSGLAEGETVVTTGNFLVDSESRLRAAIEGMGQPVRSHEHAQAEGEGR